MKYAITVLFVVVAFIAAAARRERIAASLIVLLVPFAATPFSGQFHIAIGLSAFVIWSTWIAMRTRKGGANALVSWTEISRKIVLLDGILVVGIVLAALNTHYAVLDLHDDSPFISVLNFSLYMLTLICFLKVFVNFRDDLNLQRDLNFLFAVTIFVQLGSYLLLQFGLGSYFPSFLVASVDARFGFARTGGLLGDYELIVDYVLVVVAASIMGILSNKRKNLSVLAIFAAVLVGLLSGTRSFLVVGAIFCLSLLALNLSIKRLTTSLGLGALAVVFSGDLIRLVSKYLPVDIVFERLALAYYYLQIGDYQSAANRPLLDAIPDIISTAGFFGNGSLVIFKIRDNDMVYHSLYLAAYAMFGVIGLTLLVYLFYNLVRLSYRVYRHAKDPRLRREASVVLSLVIALMVNQTKISALRYAQSILIYAFVAMNLYYLTFRYAKETKPR